MLLQHYANHLYHRSRFLIWGLALLSAVHLFAILPDLLTHPENLLKAQQRVLWFSQLFTAWLIGLRIQPLLQSAAKGQLFQVSSRKSWQQLAAVCLAAAVFPAVLLCSLLLYWGETIHLLNLLAYLNLPLLGLGLLLPFVVGLLKLSAQLEDEQNLTI